MFFYPMAKNFKMYHYSQNLRSRNDFYGKMNSCIRFRRPKTYKNDPSNEISRNSKFQNTLIIWQSKLKKLPGGSPSIRFKIRPKNGSHH